MVSQPFSKARSVAQLPRGNGHARFQRRDGLVVGIDRLIEPAVDAAMPSGHRRLITNVIIAGGGAAMKIKITTVGNSAGVILPKELLARLRLEKGDMLYATELPDGVKLSPFDPKLAGQMEVAERVMREDRSVLRKLAGS